MAPRPYKGLYRLLLIAPLVTLIMTGVFIPSAFADDLKLEATVIRVEKIDGEGVTTFTTFTATKDDITLQGVSGQYFRATDVLEAFGNPDTPVTAVKRGDGGFELSATEFLSIAVDDERLQARGNVVYVADETTATSQSLIVDLRDVIRALVEPLVAELAQREAQEIIWAFFDRASQDDRLVFMQTDVTIQQDDTTMSAGWLIFNESRTEEMVSVADPHRPVELTLTSAKQ